MAAGSNKLTDTTGIRIKKDAFVVMVKTEWNAHIVSRLEEGCIGVLKENHIAFKTVEVPGAFEIPFAVKHYWNKTGPVKPDAFIALGCVIKGDTPHFDQVCNGVTQGLMQLNLDLPVPVLNGVLTVNHEPQADERTGGKHGHKGKECAAAAIKMIAFTQSFKNNI